MQPKIKLIIKYIVVIVVLYVILKHFLLPTITSDKFRIFTTNLGFFGYFVIIGYTILSHVFAPLAGSPGVFLGITIYGMATGMFLLYIASLISASINFQIARKYGRKLVIKLVGEKSMKEIDEFATVEGKEVLLISRVLGFSLFEFISYAAGLTTISFKDYMLITSLAHAVPSLIFYFVFKNLDIRSGVGAVLWLGSIVIAGVIFGFIIKQYVKKK